MKISKLLFMLALLSFLIVPTIASADIRILNENESQNITPDWVLTFIPNEIQQNSKISPAPIAPTAPRPVLNTLIQINDTDNGALEAPTMRPQSLSQNALMGIVIAVMLTLVGLGYWYTKK